MRQLFSSLLTTFYELVHYNAIYNIVQKKQKLFDFSIACFNLHQCDDNKLSSVRFELAEKLSFCNAIFFQEVHLAVSDSTLNDLCEAFELFSDTQWESKLHTTGGSIIGGKEACLALYRIDNVEGKIVDQDIAIAPFKRNPVAFTFTKFLDLKNICICSFHLYSGQYVNNQKQKTTK